MDNSILLEAGLTPREADAYLALLELQEALVLEISRKTKENRTHLYDTLNSLMNKGFVSYVIKNGKKYFRPSSPERLIEYLQEKQDKINTSLPELRDLFKPRTNSPTIEVYEGQEGIKTVLSDVLKENKEWLCLGSTGKSKEIIPFFLEHLHKQRIKQKVSLRVIYNNDEFGEKRAKELEREKYTQIRFMSKSSPSTTYTYGNKVVIIHWEKDKLFAIMIEDKSIADSYRSYFEELWKIAKK